MKNLRKILLTFLFLLVVVIPTNVFVAPDNKEFSKWDTKSTGDGTAYDKATDTKTLYAIWQDVA